MGREERDTIEVPRYDLSSVSTFLKVQLLHRTRSLMPTPRLCCKQQLIGRHFFGMDADIRR